jgi:MtaA/CmuA family methyltransferase
MSRFFIDFYNDPDFVDELVEFVVTLGIAFSHAQVDAGADMITIGDAAASLIGPKHYQRFIFSGEQRLVTAIHEAGAICRLHICGNTEAILPYVARLGCDIVDVDGVVPMAVARRCTGEKQILCGNLDPVRSVLLGRPETIWSALDEVRREAGPRYIVAGGCEIPRTAPLANIRAMVEFAHSHTVDDPTQ